MLLPLYHHNLSLTQVPRLFRSVRRQHRHKPRLGFAGSNLHITREQRGAFFEANRCVMALPLSLSPSLLRLAAAGQKT